MTTTDPISKRLAERRAAAMVLITRALDGIEHRAPMYAQHPEAQEAQAFQFVGLRQVLHGYLDFDVHAAWGRFVESVNGEATSGTLYPILREHGMLDQLPRLLGDFARWVAVEWPAR